MQLALMLEYDADADALVTALVETGWLDPCTRHRLSRPGTAVPTAARLIRSGLRSTLFGLLE